MANINRNNDILQFLLEQNRATEEQVDQIIKYAEEYDVDIATALRESEILGSREEVLGLIAELSGYEFVRLDNIELQRDAINLIDQRWAMQQKVIPISVVDDELNVAVPIGKVKDVKLKNDLRRLTKIGVINLKVATTNDIVKAIETQFRSDTELAAIANRERDEQESDNGSDIGEEVGGESDVVRFVDMILKQAIKDKVSDIHFDPQERELRIRYRIDGILQTITTTPIFMIPEIVSRIKIMSELDIAKTREPQDGRLSTIINGKEMNFRIATLPSIYGEKVIMRVLDNSSAKLGLDDLGFSAENLERFRYASHKPYGVLLVTGPTGSGKSTTLYAALNELNSPDINIITAEDPVEYQLEGITQVPVRHPLTFEQVLRTVLRADPDVILIGEIRDKETAEIAMKAGMTGHMVFSTLHTNDAATALTRLSDMGVQPFITASTVEGIVSQRLLRRLCVKCKKPGHPTQNQLDSLGFEINEERDGVPTWFEPVGCKFCNKTGYKGRLAIHEVLLMTDELEEAVIKGEKAYGLNRMAIENGMITLKEDGFRKASRGLTTLEEVMRVVA